MKYLITRGGIVIYPLLFVSVISLTVILERFYRFFTITETLSNEVMDKIKNKISRQEVGGAAELCNSYRGPAGKILRRGVLNTDKKPEEMENLMEEVKWDVFPQLEKHLNILKYIGKISPSLGLLGTVTGMIKTFHVLSMNGQPQQLAAGISEALLTTAVGLTISIPTLGAYNYFTSKIEKMVSHVEKREMELINFVNSLGGGEE